MRTFLDWQGQFALTLMPSVSPPSAKSLSLSKIPYGMARAFVEKYHYLHYAPAGSRVCFGAFYGNRLMGTLIFTRPIARLEDQLHTLELSRMVLLDECPKNSESHVLALAAKWIKKNMPEIQRLISYADPKQGHTGTVYLAAGWRFVGRTKSSKWSNKKRKRPRADKSAGPKLKFEKILY